MVGTRAGVGGVMTPPLELPFNAAISLSNHVRNRWIPLTGR
jgi:hypothetical protein